MESTTKKQAHPSHNMEIPFIFHSIALKAQFQQDPQCILPKSWSLASSGDGKELIYHLNVKNACRAAITKLQPTTHQQHITQTVYDKILAKREVFTNITPHIYMSIP